MRKGLAPYAISAALVVVVSVAALAAALAAGGLLEERAVAAPSPTPQTTRAPVDLSRSGRLSYWRTEPTGAAQLWVANIDGSQRRVLATTQDPSRIGATRWSPDGNALAYLDREQGVVVLSLDGARSDLPLPAAVTQSGARLVDLEWSTDSRALAATLRSPAARRADIYVVSAAGGTWRNVTEVTNGFLAQWISADELLIQTQQGLIGVLRADGTGLRPLTGLSATSPFVGDDGRLYFLSGQIAPTVRDETVPVVNAAQAQVWSLTLGGDDVRQETTQRYDDVRLAGRWPSGRFMVHQGASTSLAFLGTGGQQLDTVIGIIDRVTFSPDRRTAIGLSVNRIYRYDTAQPDQPVLLLGDVARPDAWYPRSVTVTRSTTPPAAVGPKARYTFALHGLIWATDESGGVHLVRRLQTDAASLRRLDSVAIPQWSPKGDRILYFDVIANSFTGVVFVTDPTGTGARVSDQDAAGPFPSWSPDGNVAYADLIGASDSSGFSAEGQVRIVTPANAGRVTAYEAREVAFGGRKTYVIDNGALSQSPRTRIDHRILEVLPGTANRLVAAGRTLGPTIRPGVLEGIGVQLSGLAVSGDGGYLSVRLSPAEGSSGFFFAVVRASDGGSTIFIGGQDVSDVRWSPNGHLVGLTAGVPNVRDAETGVIVAAATDGRFAGWSPDGAWFYVARESGLYAYPIGNGPAVRIFAFGVPVSTTP